MAISSVGGGDVTATPGAQTATGTVSSEPATGSEGAHVAEVGKPYATIDGQDFATQADLSKWYDARQAGGGADTTTGADTQVGADTQAAGNDTATATEQQGDDALKARLKEAGGIYADPKYEPFALEFEKSGGKGLSEESLAKAAAAFGQPVEVIKAFMDGEVAKRALADSKAATPSPEMIATAAAILEVIPNEADYKAVLAWGKDNLSTSEQAAYDKALDAGDKDTVKALLGAFNAKYAASGQAKGPRDVTQEGAADGGASTGGATPYESSAQMQADMGKREYQTDPAFRAKVEARVAASKF